MINRILERLEEEKEAYSDTTYYVYGVEAAIKIVQEVAKEYGWVSVQDRLPSKEEYQKCNGQFIVSDGNRTYATYFDIYDTLRFGEPTMEKFRIDKCVIAWQPLPAPYQKGE